MSSREGVPVHVAAASAAARRRKTVRGQQKREELEREVSKLHKMLEREEKVHEVLEHALHQNENSPIRIPGFLPPKMKETLAELAMVENEIGRLEGEISNLKLGLSREKEVLDAPKFKQLQQGTQSNLHGQSSSPITQTHITKGVNERLSFETKALYFINKAIKGDYMLNEFNANEKTGNSKLNTDEKENYGHEEAEFQEKVLRKSGILKSSSPKRSKPVEHDQGISLDLLPKSLANSNQDDKNQKWQPNKLSESIMKCLTFVFVRLIRTSRTMELEKFGNISRTTHSSLSSRSFRAESGLNSKASILLQKESRQQDPYGIFDIDDSIPRDIGPYKNFVRFTSSSLDPKCISNSSSIPLIQKLRVLMKNLHNVDLRFLSYQQKLAFWINMYNACIMHGFLQFGVPSSPEKMLILMNKAKLDIGGNKLNALEIEHFILRQQSSSNLKDADRKEEKDDKESIVRSIYGLETPEPNVTFALCCGTRSSPAVRIYTADGVSNELEKSKLEYLQASIVVTETKRLLIPELLLRNMFDFAQDIESLVEWICQQLPASGSLRKSMVDCLREHNDGKISVTVEKMPYEFEFQYLLDRF